MFQWRFGLRDICLLVAALGLGLGLAYRYDFFRRAGAAAPRAITPGEAVVVGAVVALAMVGLGAWRKKMDERDEIQRQEQAELTHSFESALSKFVLRQPGEPTPDPEHEDVGSK